MVKLVLDMSESKGPPFFADVWKPSCFCFSCLLAGQWVNGHPLSFGFQGNLPGIPAHRCFGVLVGPVHFPLYQRFLPDRPICLWVKHRYPKWNPGKLETWTKTCGPYSGGLILTHTHIPNLASSPVSCPLTKNRCQSRPSTTWSGRRSASAPRRPGARNPTPGAKWSGASPCHMGFWESSWQGGFGCGSK